MKGKKINVRLVFVSILEVTGSLSGWSVGLKDRGFESRQEHKINFEFFRVKKVVPTRCRCAQPPCVYAPIRKTMYARTKSCSPCKSSMDYGNTKITSKHLYPGRRNVAAQVADELKTVTYATPPMEERTKKERKKIIN